MTDQRLEHLLIIAGIPGTGKSTFAAWLSESHGYAHQDVDWKGLPSIAMLAKPRVVVDWGFPANEPGLTNALDCIQGWIQSGAQLWWFDGDRDAALHNFLKRGTVSRAAWNYQLHGIETNWHRIVPLVKGRSIKVIAANSHLSNEEIFRRMNLV